MIKQIKKITGTGKFLEYDSSQTTAIKEFAATNLIYGDNGSGKTTLALLFRSLKGENELLPRKRSFDLSVAQEVSILTDHSQDAGFSFSKNKWNQFLPSLEVFDVHFINDNIYTGLEIGSSHKKNLFEIILGEQGVRSKNAIALLKDRIRNGNKVVREATKQIELSIENAYPALEYAALSADTEIEEKIKWKQQEIETAKNFETIAQKPLLTILPLVKLPYDTSEVENIFQQSIDNISKDFLQQFNDHKDHLQMEGDAEEWIQKGVEAMQHDACPFCKKQLDGSENIITAYQQYFNQDYNDLIAKITRLETVLDSFNPEAILLDIENKITNNLLLIDFWKDFVTAPIELTSIISKKEDLVSAFEKVKKAVDQKSKNPVQSHPTVALEVIDNQLVSINETLKGFNKKIDLFNQGVETIKASEAVAVSKLEQELLQLFAIKKRNTPEIEELCNNLNTYSKAIDQLKTSMKTKQKELDVFKNSVFVGFGKKANHYLQLFAPYLQIKNLSSGYQGSSTDPAVKFGLYVSGNPLNQKKDAIESTFKYSLSEGDKSALALSFFLAKLSLDQDLANKVIVFDDPVSSFDNNRKTAMLQELLAIGNKAAQLFIFTHDRNLANDVVLKTKKETMQLNCYKLGFDGRTALLADV